MIKSHEIKIDAAKLSDVITSQMFVTDVDVKVGDFVLLQADAEAKMFKVVNGYADAGLKNGFMILKLKIVD